MTPPTDRPAAAGADPPDPRALAAWLADRVEGLETTSGGPEIHRFVGGASNLTYLLRYPSRDLVLRRPPAGPRRGRAHDMAREYEIQRRLRPHFAYVPEVHALCEDERVIGAPFYVMERVEGVIPRARMPTRVGVRPERLAALAERFVAVLAELHAIDVTATGLADLGRGPGYVERQVGQWAERFRRARTDDVPDFEAVIDWLESNRPPDSPRCVIHNDFRLDNLVLDGGPPLVVKGVLDWELATVGDPLMDLGTALAYWVQPDDDPVARGFKRQPTDLEGFPSRREVVERYVELTGRDLRAWRFYEVFGLFRLAGITQQIYRRYRQGDSSEPEFRGFWRAVGATHERCREIIRADA